MSARPVQISLDSDLLTQVDAVSEAREKDGEASSERQRIEEQLAHAYAGKADSLLEEIEDLVGRASRLPKPSRG